MLRAQFEGSDHAMVHVDFYVDGAWVGGTSEAPFGVSWLVPDAGVFLVTAIAVDRTGASASSPAIELRAAHPTTD
jgi:hypothetical protein